MDDNIQTDDMYPNDSSYFRAEEPAEQVVSRQKEKAKTLEALPILKDIVKRLEKDIAFYGSVDAMPDDCKDDPTRFLIMHNGNELARNIIRAEKEWIEGLLEDYAPNL